MLPELLTLTAGALSQARFILSGLQVHPERMRANLDLTHGLVVSEAVMMGLATFLARQRAHDLVYDLCREAAERGVPLRTLLLADPEIRRSLEEVAIARLTDPQNHLGLAGEMVNRVLA